LGLDFSTTVYLPNYEVFARPFTVTPKASQPGEPTYSARGIFDTQEFEVMLEDGTVMGTQRPIMDIIESEFPVLPQKYDIIDIPDDAEGPGRGRYEVIDSSSNGIETTLNLRKMVYVKP
jgi:hypothetical protein